MMNPSAEERMAHYAPNEYGRYLNPVRADWWHTVDKGTVIAAGSYDHCLQYLDPHYGWQWPYGEEVACDCGHNQYCGPGCGGHSE